MEAEENEEQRGKKSKYARKDQGTTSKKPKFDEEGEEKSKMIKAYTKLSAAKMIFENEISPDLVSNNPKLEQFQCWTANDSVSGICIKNLNDKSKSYLQIGSTKYQKYAAHKLSLCVKMDCLYSALEHKNLETSHLCHNHICWRPSHLEAENHKMNTNRKCTGNIYNLSTKTLYSFCTHTVACKIVTVIENFENHVVYD